MASAPITFWTDVTSLTVGWSRRNRVNGTNITSIAQDFAAHFAEIAGWTTRIGYLEPGWIARVCHANGTRLGQSIVDVTVLSILALNRLDRVCWATHCVGTCDWDRH